MIRILHVVTSMNMGGIENFIMNVYRQIDRSRVQFDFLMHRPERSHFDDEIESLGGRIFRVPGISPGSLFRCIRELSAFFTGHPEYHIVHSHMNALSALPLLLARRHGLQVRIAHSHITSAEGNGFRSLAKHSLRHLLRPQATEFFACSRAAGIWLFGRKASEQRPVRVVNNAIDARRFRFSAVKRSKLRTDLGLVDQYVVGHVGRFHVQKNHEFLVQVFGEMCKLRPNCHLILLGDGGMRQSIERTVTAMGLSEVVSFLGIRDDTEDLLQAMDVFVFPSLYEGLGIVAIEAQASGLRTVLSDAVPEEALVTDLAEVIPLSMPASHWAQHILQYSDGYERRDTYDEIVNAGYDVVENAKWLEDFYLRHAYEQGS